MNIASLCLFILLQYIPLNTKSLRCHSKVSQCLHIVGFLRKSVHPSKTTRHTAKHGYSDAREDLPSREVDEGDYINSSEYQRLRNLFSDSEREIENQIFVPLKNDVVYKQDGFDVFIPNSSDLNAVAAVPELFHENFSLRNENHWETLMQIRSLYVEKLLQERSLEEISSRRSELAKNFHLLPESEKEFARESNSRIRDKAKNIEAKTRQLNEKICSLLETLPNILSEDVPLTDCIVEKTVSDKVTYDRNKKLLPHYQVLERLSLPCTLRSIEISGTGYSSFSGDVCRLERALANFMLDTHRRLFNYTEITVPLVVSETTVKRTGHLPRFEQDLFRLDDRHQSNGGKAYLIPTAEVPLLALFSNTRIQDWHLPIWVMAYTPCFRSEIQNYGRETRGLIRNHQFGKVELVCLCDRNNSHHFHNLMISHIEYILEALELPYRRVLLSAAETGSASSKTVDFEVFFPSLNKYIEVSSCSNTRDYQSIRLNLFSRKKSKIHCLNGSGLAIGRTLSAILENYQNQDSSRLEIIVPKVLQPYLDGQETLREPITRC